MKTKHIFVHVLDVAEKLPFAVRRSDNLEQEMADQDRARNELVVFIDKLEQNFNEGIYYLGFDEIGGKFYERFILENGGFFEVMVEEPLAMNGHFVNTEQAERFATALKKTFSEILSDEHYKQMFLDSIVVQSEDDQSLTYKKWETLKNMSED